MPKFIAITPIGPNRELLPVRSLPVDSMLDNDVVILDRKSYETLSSLLKGKRIIVLSHQRLTLSSENEVIFWSYDDLELLHTTLLKQEKEVTVWIIGPSIECTFNWINEIFLTQYFYGSPTGNSSFLPLLEPSFTVENLVHCSDSSSYKYTRA